MNSSNKYVGKRHPDSRMVRIVYNEGNGCRSGLDFGFAVSILQKMPPDHFHALLHGFNSLKAMEKYCRDNGVAIYKTGI